MLDDSIKSVLIRDRFLKLIADFESNKFIDSSMMLHQFKNSKFLNDDIIDLITMEYYVKNRYLSNGVLDTIKRKYDDKSFLHTMFYNNDSYAFELIHNAFSIDFNSIDRRDSFECLSITYFWKKN